MSNIWTPANDDHDLSERQILNDVDVFITRNDLGHIRDVLRKGAFLAHGLSDWELVEGLTLEEKETLHSETSKKERGKRRGHLFLIGVNLHPMILSFPVTTFTEMLFVKDAFGEYISAPWTWCLFLGCICAPFFGHALGHRRTLLVGLTLAAAASVALSAICSPTTSQGLLNLLLESVTGLGSGLAICTIPIYLLETSPQHMRGVVLSEWWSFMSFGQLLAFMPKPGLPLPYAPLFYTSAQAVVPIIFVRTYESPWWYMIHGEINRAFDSFRRFHGADILAARELFRVHLLIDGNISDNNSTIIHRFLDLATVPKLRRITFASLAVMASGGLGVATAGAILSFTIDLIAMILEPIESDWGPNTVELLPYALSLMGVFGLFTLIFSAYGWSMLHDRSPSRRTYLTILFLLSPMTILIQLLISRTMMIVMRVVVMTILSLCFVMVTTLGPGIITLPYIAQILPPSHRDVGTGVSLVVYFGAQRVVQLFWNHGLWCRIFGVIGQFS